MWQFFLARTDNLSLIAEIPGTSRKIEYSLNKPGSASFSIPLDHRVSYEIKELSTSIIAVRRGIPKWAGPIWTASVDAPSNKLNVTAIGWFEELNHRIVRGAYTNNAGTVVPAQVETFTNIDAGTIARSLVSKANAQADNAGTARPTYIKLPAAFDLSQTRTRTYNADENIGSSITELSDIEGGFDFYVDNLTREFHVVYKEIIVGSTVRGIGRDNRNLVLSYGWGPANLSGAGYTSDASRSCQRMTARGKLGSAIAENRQAMNDLGFMFEETTSLPDLTDGNLLLAFAGAEIAVRAYPQRFYNIQPFPFTPGGRFPEPTVDFAVGDFVSLTARSGAWNDSNKTVRIYRMTIDIDDNGNERISSLETNLG